MEPREETEEGLLEEVQEGLLEEMVAAEEVADWEAY